MTATVVISTRDRPDQLRRCLEAVGKAVRPGDEIIVVDSASNSHEVVREIATSAGARIYKCEDPGATRARNLGIEHARGEIIAFTDDDAFVDTRWLECLALPFVDENVSAVVGPVFTLDSDPPRLLAKYAKFDAAEDRTVFRKSEAGWFERLRLGAVGSGANFAVRREFFERNGRFRECLGAGAPVPGDETFFFFSTVVNGGTVVNEPSARVFHAEHPEHRVVELRKGRVAYWLYASCNYPLTIPRSVLSVARRLVRKRAQAADNFGRPQARLLDALLHAPGLLIAAWRFSRWK